MFNIRYSYEAYSQIDSFINSYKNIFLKLYSDTWIEDEDLIIKNYVDIWNKFYLNIKTVLENTFKHEVVFWKSIDKDNKNYITISINNFRLFVHYTESISLKERYIENIEFFRK